MRHGLPRAIPLALVVVSAAFATVRVEAACATVAGPLSVCVNTYHWAAFESTCLSADVCTSTPFTEPWVYACQARQPIGPVSVEPRCTPTVGGHVGAQRACPGGNLCFYPASTADPAKDRLEWLGAGTGLRYSPTGQTRNACVAHECTGSFGADTDGKQVKVYQNEVCWWETHRYRHVCTRDETTVGTQGADTRSCVGEEEYLEWRWTCGSPSREVDLENARVCWGSLACASADQAVSFARALAFDADGDGVDTPEEATQNADPADRRSRPDTDDDCDGKSNAEERDRLAAAGLAHPTVSMNPGGVRLDPGGSEPVVVDPDVRIAHEPGSSCP